MPHATPLLRRTGVRRWAVTLGVLGVVAGVIAALGGFATARRPPASARPGDVVTLTRWDVVVTRAQLAKVGELGLPSPEPTLQVHLMLTNRWDHSVFAPDRDVMRVELPSGQVQSRFMAVLAPGQVGNFDPDLPRPGVLTITPERPLTPGEVVRVHLYDESPEESNIYSDYWVPTEKVAIVEVPIEAGDP